MRRKQTHIMSTVFLVLGGLTSFACATNSTLQVHLETKDTIAGQEIAAAGAVFIFEHFEKKVKLTKHTDKNRGIKKPEKMFLLTKKIPPRKEDCPRIFVEKIDTAQDVKKTRP